MINPGLPNLLWIELDGRLWHATDHQGLLGIVADGCIRVSAGDRYKNSICRRLECVSIFDFGREAIDQDDFMFSNWFSWLGSEHADRCAIWLEIDREKSTDQLIGPTTLREIVRSQPLRGRFFVGVEGCHKGPIAMRFITGALILDRYDCSLFRRYVGKVDNVFDEVASFLESLPPPPPEPPSVRAGN